MPEKIHLNGNPLQITEDLLPCLISYHQGAGGSHFSVRFLADLFLSGSKILFMTAYPMATEDFLSQIGDAKTKLRFLSGTEDITGCETFQGIMVQSGKEELFRAVIAYLPDLRERVIFLKNMETFEENTVKECLGYRRLILSGDLDASKAQQDILKKKFASTILFHQPKADTGYTVPPLEKYAGYMWSDTLEGVVKTEEEPLH